MAEEAAKKKKKFASGRHLSAIKRHRQNKKRAMHNRTVRMSLKGALKKVRLATQGKKKKEAEEALRLATSLLAKAAQRNIVHPGYASRHTGRLSSLVHRI